MQFIDLERQYETIKENVDSRIRKVLDTKHFIMGEEITELEKRLAEFCGRKYCLTCGSGTDALVIPLMAYELKKTDAVFVPSFTFFASAESVNLAGGTPVFVDIDETFNIDVEKLNKAIEGVIKEGKLNPRGIIPVDLFGRTADFEKILPIAEKYGLFVLEDAAQGFGGAFKGKRNGGFGDVSATSFFPAKPLGCYGDGGAIFTDDERLYDIMHSIRVHGQGTDKYDNVRIGMNGRMDSIQAAVVLSKLEVFENELENRQVVAKKYIEKLKESFVVPIVSEDYYSAWAQFTLRAKDNKHREFIIEKMKQKDIPVMVYYPIPLHKQTAYADNKWNDGNLDFCEKVSNEVFSIPMHPYLTDKEISFICDSLLEIDKEYGK